MTAPEALEPFEKPVRFDRLAALLPALEARDEHVDSKLFSLAHDDGVIYKNFDWPTYMKTLEGEHFAPAQVVDADLVKCRKLLTIIVRQERFCDGSLAGHVQEGFAGALVRRILELTSGQPPDLPPNEMDPHDALAPYADEPVPIEDRLVFDTVTGKLVSRPKKKGLSQ